MELCDIFGGQLEPVQPDVVREIYISGSEKVLKGILYPGWKLLQGSNPWPLPEGKTNLSLSGVPFCQSALIWTDQERFPDLASHGGSEGEKNPTFYKHCSIISVFGCGYLKVWLWLLEFWRLKERDGKAQPGEGEVRWESIVRLDFHTWAGTRAGKALEFEVVNAGILCWICSGEWRLWRQHTAAAFWEFWWLCEHPAIYIYSTAALVCLLWGLFRLFIKCQKELEAQA